MSGTSVACDCADHQLFLHCLLFTCISSRLIRPCVASHLQPKHNAGFGRGGVHLCVVVMAPCALLAANSLYVAV